MVMLISELCQRDPTAVRKKKERKISRLMRVIQMALCFTKKRNQMRRKTVHRVCEKSLVHLP